MQSNILVRAGLLIQLVVLSSCMATSEKAGMQAMDQLIDDQFRFAAKQYKVLMQHTVKDSMPRTWYALENKFRNDNLESWISGFYPATLLYIYEYTKDKEILTEAESRLELQKKMRHFSGHHDGGFMIYCPFGNAYRLTGKQEYREVIHDAAKALSTRFRPQVNSIQSWDSSRNFRCPVIIDNMMNLEMMYWVSNDGGDSLYRNIAVAHANKTLQNHFRPDNSSWHVVDYDPATGNVARKATWQGLADSSAWSRGQGWGLYGFTFMYRFTKDTRYLEQAHKIAKFILNHPNMPADKIPVWDFNAKGDISVLRDASAAAIMASALLELSIYSNEADKKLYRETAETMIRSLASDKYRANVGENGGFLLKHSVGALPLHNEIDVPLTYADYYWLEAMLRYRHLVIEGNKDLVKM